MEKTPRSKPAIRIGTRGSLLARRQADWVKGALRRAFPDHEFVQVVVRTSGDIRKTQPLARFAGFGVFTRELDNALLDGRIDLAVHSAKDYPIDVSPRLSSAAFPCREAANDSLVARGGATLVELAQGARIGTGSLRRSAQLAHLRPDLRFGEIRGNINSRLRKLEAGKYDAVIIAEAALRRLKVEAPREVLPVNRVVPAAGEGALMIVCRFDDTQTKRLVQRINNDRVSRCVVAERMVLFGLGGGCRLPIGVHARIMGDSMRIRAVVLSPDSRQKVGAIVEGRCSNPTLVAEDMVHYLLDHGGGDIIEQVGGESGE